MPGRAIATAASDGGEPVTGAPDQTNDDQRQGVPRQRCSCVASVSSDQSTTSLIGVKKYSNRPGACDSLSRTQLVELVDRVGEVDVPVVGEAADVAQRDRDDDEARHERRPAAGD